MMYCISFSTLLNFTSIALSCANHWDLIFTWHQLSVKYNMLVSGHHHLTQCYIKNYTVLTKRCRKIDPLDQVSIYLIYLINDVFVMRFNQEIWLPSHFYDTHKEIITILWQFLICWTLNLLGFCSDPSVMSLSFH